MIDFSKSKEDLSKQIGIRLDARQRYLTDIAMEIAHSESVTEYVKGALDRSFKGLSLYRPELVYDEDNQPVALNPEQERVEREAKSLDNLAATLWHESPFMRLEVLSRIAPHLVSDADKALLLYIRNRADLKTESFIHEKGPYFGKKGYVLNRDKIDAEWEFIRAAFTKSKGNK